MNKIFDINKNKDIPISVEVELLLQNNLIPVINDKSPSDKNQTNLIEGLTSNNLYYK
jgi:hypothetical protein